MNEIILQNKDGQVLASSRDIAEKFGKRHSEVIYAIEGRIDGNGKVKNNGLLMSGISQLSKMFIKNGYIDSMNRTKFEYLINRDGFSLLVMGFTGKEALQWKLKYIEAFNKMEEKLKSGSYLSEEEKLKLQLFSKDPLEVAAAHNKLVELKTKPLLKTIDTQNQTIDKQEKQLENEKPLVQFALDVQKSEDYKKVREVAKIFSSYGTNIGEKRLFVLLREHKLLMKNNEPYQKYVDAGIFSVKLNKTNTVYGTVKINNITLVTGKGLVYLYGKVRKWMGLGEDDITLGEFEQKMKEAEEIHKYAWLDNM